MKNFTGPLNKITKFSFAASAMNRFSETEILLQANEFTDNIDTIGFFKKEYDPIEYLSIDEFS